MERPPCVAVDVASFCAPHRDLTFPPFFLLSRVM